MHRQVLEQCLEAPKPVALWHSTQGSEQVSPEVRESVLEQLQKLVANRDA